MRVHLTIGDILDLIKYSIPQVGSPRAACRCRRCKRLGFDPWVGKIPWKRKWQPIPVFLPGKSHGQSSLVGYSPWGCKELDMQIREQICTHTTVHSPELLHLRTFYNELSCDKQTILLLKLVHWGFRYLWRRYQA